MFSYGGQKFSDEIIGRIRKTVTTEPQVSRRQLSLQVCEWLGWRNRAGRLQEMSCRKAMLAMHRQGIIILPEVKKLYPFQKSKQNLAVPPIAEVACSLAELGDIRIIRVVSSEQSALWRSMMDGYHYLKSGPLCGAQLRYLVRSENYGWLGGLSYSASARRVEARDHWIDWTEDERRRNHCLVVNNSRFLIAPSVKVKNLASHVLSLSQARLVEDWESVYRYQPVLLETYVERGRFAGTCYRAANWRHVGITRGRGRKGTGASPKDIYVMPLTVSWQVELCRGDDGRVHVRKEGEAQAPRDWIASELGRTDLGDSRLTARLLQMTGMFYAKPTANVPQACGSAKATKAAYRFLDNEAVEWQAILSSHYEATQGRIREHALVLVAQDTTTLNYSTHPHTVGLGPIGNDIEEVRGLMLHDTMAFTSKGTPLGLLDVQCWARIGIGSRHERHRKPIEDKESWKWIESYQAVSATQNRCRKTRMVVVADREADIHEVFSACQQTPHGAHLLIRAERSRNRKVLDNDLGCEYLWSILNRQPIIGTRDILIPPSENRAARQALLEVRATPITLKPPRRKKHLTPVRVWAVLAREIDPPEGVEALEWMLLTTVEVKNSNDAYERLEWYARRWGIEVYHRILKSGCRVEARQMEQARRLKNCLAIDMVVAWRIHYLTTLGRETPDLPCTVYFTDSEWKALATFTTKSKTPPEIPPCLNDAVRMLGKLGGHLGRAGDGQPGTEVLWRGMARLTDIEMAYNLYQ